MKPVSTVKWVDNVVCCDVKGLCYFETASNKTKIVDILISGKSFPIESDFLPNLIRIENCINASRGFLQPLIMRDHFEEMANFCEWIIKNEDCECEHKEMGVLCVVCRAEKLLQMVKENKA